METTRKTDENGNTSSTNFMLDDIIDAFNEKLPDDELIKKLTIQKIEYGRTCIAQLQCKGTYSELDKDLQLRIYELGGKPIEIHLPK